MKILFLTKYFPEGASSRYRYYNYKDYFIRNGFEVEYKPLLRDGYVKRYYNGEKNKKIDLIIDILKRIIFIMFNKKKYDFIIIEKELIMYCPYFIEYFLLRGTKYSLDFDDNPKAPYMNGFLKKLISKNKIDKLVKNASFCTVGNKWYFEEFFFGKLIYLPTVIEKNKYIEKKDYKIKEKVTIVWIGSKSTSKYLELITESLKKLNEKYPIRLNVIGGKIESNDFEINCIEWNEETEVIEILEGDIGIMPLEDTYWEKGKCGFKLIQYMGCGLPVVASPSPANNEIIKQNENGYIAKSQNEWFYFLEKLIKNEDLRRYMGNNNKVRIRDCYSYEANWRKYYNEIKRETVCY